MSARCRFFLNGELLGLGAHGDMEEMLLDHPPVVDDIVHLSCGPGRPAGRFVVTARRWIHAMYGSTGWPEGRDRPLHAPILDLIVLPVPPET